MAKICQNAVIGKKRRVNLGNIAVSDGGFASVVHTKETLRRFSSKDVGSHEQRSSFLMRHYRWRNLSLADGIENSSLLLDLDTILDNAVISGEVSLDIKLNANGNEKKVYQLLDVEGYRLGTLKQAIKHRTALINTIVGLRYCCRSIVVGENDGTGHIVASSNSCKKQHCCLCARRKGAKYGSRLHAALEDDDNKILFKGKYFYFVTLTLKHDEFSRGGVYLDDLSKSMGKLFRSKFWKGITNGGGWLSHIETTMKNGEFHIHAHVLVCCDRIKVPVKKVNEELRKTWHKITGDSFVVAWDLVRGKKVKDKKIKFDPKSKKSIQGAVLELFKYSTKVGAIGKLTSKDFDGFSNFVAWTVGKKFIRAGGFFKGLEITSLKSKYDTPAPDVELPYDRFFGLAATNARFNRNPCRDYGKRYRDNAIKTVYLESISGFDEIVEESIGWYFSEDPRKGTLGEYLERLLIFDDLMGGIELSDEEKNKAIERVQNMDLGQLKKQQMTLFDSD